MKLWILVYNYQYLNLEILDLQCFQSWIAGGKYILALLRYEEN